MTCSADSLTSGGVLGKIFFSDRVVKHWNRLSREVVEVFKKSVDVALKDIV